jgi:hypothetical protein
MTELHTVLMIGTVVSLRRTISDGIDADVAVTVVIHGEVQQIHFTVPGPGLSIGDTVTISVGYS